MNIVRVLSSLLLTAAAATSGSSTAQSSLPAERLAQVWEKSTEVAATVGGRPVAVFKDPQFQSDLVVFDSKRCWVIRQQERQVISPGCGIFERTGDTLTLKRPAADLADVYWEASGRLTGAPWADVISDCASLISLFFRSPDFGDKGIEFWGCDEMGWVKVAKP